MWPFRKSRPKSAKLEFASSVDFFDYQCKLGQTELQPKRGVVAIVIGDAQVSGQDNETRRHPNGTETLQLLVASLDGGFSTLADTAAHGPKLLAGDIVIWVPLDYLEDKTLFALDARMCWYGIIAAKIAPVIDPSSSTFEILYQYG